MNVENKPFFSAVIYMSNEFASATLDSIFSQKDIAAENIQIVLALGGQNEYSEYISGLKHYRVQGHVQYAGGGVFRRIGACQRKIRLFPRMRRGIFGEYVCIYEGFARNKRYTAFHYNDKYIR